MRESWTTVHELSVNSRANYEKPSDVAQRGLTIGCSGCGAGHTFGGTQRWRGGPAPLTLVSLGRWASIAAATGGSHSRLAWVPVLGLGAGGEPAESFWSSDIADANSLLTQIVQLGSLGERVGLKFSRSETDGSR
jgi:hypothetical protein